MLSLLPGRKTLRKMGQCIVLVVVPSSLPPNDDDEDGKAENVSAFTFPVLLLVLVETISMNQTSSVILITLVSFCIETSR